MPFAGEGIARRDAAALAEILEQRVSSLIESADPAPTIIVLEGRPGRGKTFVAQQLFDRLARSDTSGYWRPGMAPQTVITDAESLRTSRKHILAEVADPLRRPKWHWFGLQCGAMGAGDPAASSLLWQVHTAVRHLLSLPTERRSTHWRAVEHVSTAIMEIASEGFTHVSTLAGLVHELIDLYSERSIDLEKIEEDQTEQMAAAVREALGQLSDHGTTSIVVIDDAHMARPQTLRALATALTYGARPEEGRRYFDRAASASRQRLIVLATAWSPPFGTEFWKWWEESGLTNVNRVLYPEGEGWFPGISRDTAIEMFEQALPNPLPSTSIEKMVDRGIIDQRITPYLLMSYIVDAVEREWSPTDDFERVLGQLPSTAEDIGRQRFSRLNKTERDALVIAAALGYSFPLGALEAILRLRTGSAANADAALRSLQAASYLLTAEGDSAILRNARFDLDFDFQYSRATADTWAWVKDVVHRGLKSWLKEQVLSYLRHDLSPEGPLIPIDVVGNAIAPIAQKLLAREQESDDEVVAVCSAVSIRWGDAAQARRWPIQDPKTFGEYWAISVAGGTRVLDEPTLAWLHDLAAQSRTIFKLARNVLNSDAASPETRELAVRCLRETLSYRPAVYTLANYYVSRGELPAALEILRRGAADPVTAVRLGLLLVQTGQRAEARRVLQAVASDPQAAIHLAELLLGDGESVEAQAVLEKVATEATAAARLADLLEKEGQYDKARDVLRNVASAPQAVLRLAQLHVARGERAEARDVLRKFPNEPMTAVRLADLLAEDGDRAQAEDVLRPVATSPTGALRLADLLIDGGRRAEAVKVLQQARDETNVAIRLADLLVEDGRSIDAYQVLRRYPADPHVALRLADLLLDMKNPGEARDILSKCADDPQVAVRLADLFLIDGKREEAFKVLEGVVSDPHAAGRLAELLLQDGKRSEAREVLRKSAWEASGAKRLVDVLLEDGERAEAVAVLRKAARHPHAAVRLADMLLEDGERAQARDALRAVKHDPHVAVRLAELMIEDGERAQALDLLRSVKNDSHAAMRLAELLLEDGQRAEAREVLTNVAGEESGAMSLAGYEASEGNFAAASAILSSFAGRNPLAALMLVRNAVSKEELRNAQTIVAEHANDPATRWFVFFKMTEHLRSAADVLRVFPRSSVHLEAYVQHLSVQAKSDPKAAALYALLAASVFPKFNSLAIGFVQPHAASDPWCACAMARLRLPPLASHYVLRMLSSHATSGDRTSVFALADLSLRMNDWRGKKLALELMSKQQELTDEEKELYARLAGPALRFRKIREEPRAAGNIGVWEVAT